MEKNIAKQKINKKKERKLWTLYTEQMPGLANMLVLDYLNNNKKQKQKQNSKI